MGDEEGKKEKKKKPRIDKQLVALQDLTSSTRQLTHSAPNAMTNGLQAQQTMSVLNTNDQQNMTPRVMNVLQHVYPYNMQMAAMNGMQQLMQMAAMNGMVSVTTTLT